MKREKELEQLSRKYDGELDLHRAAEMETAALSQRAVEAERAWTKIGEQLRSLPVPTPPAEVMWSDVRRSIRLSKEEGRDATPARPRWHWALGVVTASCVVLAGLFLVRILVAPSAYASTPRVEWVEAELPGSSAMVYEDEASGAVVIWLMTPNEEPGNARKS